MVVFLTGCVTIYGVLRWNMYTQEQKTADAKAFIDIFQYITTNENRVFDYIAVAKELNFSEDELVSYLFALERAGKIKVTPRYLARKPIVISHNDREWYFHRVTLPHTEVPDTPGLPSLPQPQN